MDRPTAVSALAPEQLYRKADLSRLTFNTTADLDPVDGMIGQPRAEEAIRFAAGMSAAGYNLFVIGRPGARLHEAIREMLANADGESGSPPDWVYVNNFNEPHKPIAMRLPPARAPLFRAAMHELIDDLKTALPAVFESEDYQTRRGAIDESFQRRQAEAFTALREKAASQGVVIVRTPLGFALAPARNGEVVPPEEFNSWPEDKKRAIQQVIQSLEKDLEHVVRLIPSWDKMRRDETRALNRETAQMAVGQSIEEAKALFSDLPAVTSHLEKVQADLIENVAIFAAKSEEGESEARSVGPGGVFDRYEVNVLVTQADQTSGAPIIEELHPTLSNLIGRIEYLARQGALVTNFRLIKAGALHRANGGYLLLDARNLLGEPFSWSALKRALHKGEITTEDIGRYIGLTSTVSLEPDPIPLKVKVVLFGERLIYYLLAALDPDLSEHFKVLADFEDDLVRSAENEALLARFIASLAKRAGLKSIDRDGVATLIEHAARLSGHANKMTLVVEQLKDVLTEADFWASKAGRDATSGPDVRQAIERRDDRSARLRDRTHEAILEGLALIDTDGRRVGQVNGLSVIDLGGFAFGRPTRITCRVRPGTGKVVDIEREVELGGPLHSKGILILSGFLAGRYALDAPMSLFASLVFEQSYAGVEGDSASSAELYALLSALSELPLRQDFAVTGSVNQHGEVQAIGVVNEKIEGFFDTCNARGLTGQQGVLIPQANVQNLMLRADVIEACRAGRFAVLPIRTIDEGVAVLTATTAGERGADGSYPEGSVNRLVEDRLRAFANVRRSFAVAETRSLAERQP